MTVLPLAQALVVRAELLQAREPEHALPLLAEAGIEPRDDPETSRKLILDTNQDDVKLVIIRASDVPTYCQYGAADLGVAGKDVLLEHGGEGLEVELDELPRRWPEAGLASAAFLRAFLPLPSAGLLPPLPVGGTPLLPVPRLRRELAMPDLWVKDDSRNPSGSTKDRASLLVVAKALKDYSFSEIAQIVEGNNTRLLGAFITEIRNEVVQVTLKMSDTNINEVLQTFRRYRYSILFGSVDDQFLEELRQRSGYLDKYLNV